jgi:hypothetical protein
MGITLMEIPSAKAQGVLHDLGVAQQDIATGSAAMTQALKDSGLTQEQLAKDLRQPDGIFVALEDLKTKMTEDGIAASQQGAIIADIFGGARTGKAIMALYESLDGVQSKFKSTNAQESQWGEDWQATLHTMTQRWHEFASTLEADGIKLGHALGPVTSELLDGLVKGVKGASVAFDGLTTVVQKEPGYVLAFVGAFAAYKTIPPLIGAIGNAYLGLVAKVDSARTAVTALGGEAGFAGGIAVAGAWGLALGGAGAALQTIMHRASDARAAVDQLTGSVDKNSAASLRGAITNLNDQLLKLQDLGKNPAGSSFGKNEAEADALKKKIKELTGELNALEGKQAGAAKATATQAAVSKDAAAKVKELSAAFRATPQAQFTQFMKDVKKAEDDLQASTKANNDTLSGQIDLLKGYQTQADVTASSIRQHILDSIKLMANEGDNLKALAANGVDPKFIKKLYDEGPEYVAAVASMGKQAQVQLGQQFEQGLTQQMHTAAAAARAEAPEAAKTVADAAAFAAEQQKAALQKKFYDAVQSAVTEARKLAASGGDDTAGAFGVHAENGKNAVLAHMLAALPEPVRQATEAALGIATTAGGKLPQDLASAINQHRSVAEQAAELLRRAIQGRIDLLHDKTIDVKVRDEATDQLNTIKQAISGVATAVSEFHFFGGGAPMQGPVVPGGHRWMGGLIVGPGTGTSDTAGVYALSNGETVVPANLTPKYAPLFAADGIPGFASGGLVGTDGSAIGDYWRILLDYTNVSKGVANAAQPYAAAASGATGSRPVAAWAPQILAALALVGAPASWLPLEERIMQLESGGSTTVVNPIGDAAGHAIGLMQMKLPTFLAYALPGMTDIYNGFDQLVSSIRYQIADYGGPQNIPGVLGGHYGGYAAGGVAQGWSWVGEHGPELMNVGSPSRVLSHKESLAALAPSLISTTEVHVHFDGPAVLDRGSEHRLADLVLTGISRAKANGARMPTNLNI